LKVGKKLLTVSGEEEDRYGCSYGVIHGGIPHDEACLQLEVPTAVTANILDRKVGEECWNSGLDGRLEVVVASIQLEATLAVTSEVA
jgi:hypothetical protein